MEINILKFLRRQDGFKETFKRMHEKERVRKQVLVVPEKFGVSAERAMFEESGCEASFFMDITTFDRLADEYVVDKNIQYLSKSAGVMLVQKIAQDLARDLSVLSQSCGYNGFCENVFNTIMLLKSSMVSPSQLLDATAELADVSKLKLKDLQAIYEQYETTLKDRFIDSANKMNILAKELEFDESISNVDFYIYSPKLTKQILYVCAKLTKCAHSVTFLVDEYVENSNVYDENYAEICAMLKQENAKFDEWLVTPSTLALELKAVGTKRRFYDESVKFFSYVSLADEVDGVCRDVIESGDRFKDCAILVCDIDKYKTTLEKSLRDFNIPYFMDTQVTLVDMAPTKFLLGFISLVFEFRVDKLLAVVKSAYFDFDKDKVQNFELYIKRWGINERNYYSKNKPQDDLYDDFNHIYAEFNNNFQNFKENLRKSATYHEMTDIIREYLVSFNLEQKIDAEAKNLEELHEFQRAKQYEQVYKKWQGVFDQLDNILGLNEVTVKDYYTVLRAGFNAILVKTPPLMVDSVYIGDISSAMIYNAKNLYVLGAVENSFPVFTQDCGLILDAELDKMRTQAEIDPTIRAVNREAMTTILNNIVCCSRLTLSYPVSMFFVEQKPATFLQQLLKLFVDELGGALKFGKKESVNILAEPQVYARSLVSHARAEYEVYRLSHNVEAMQNAHINARVSGIAKKLNLQLRADKVMPRIPRELKKSSVSQLQGYFECPYKNFAQYGLKLRENIDNTLKPIDVGNFMHKVAELFGAYLIKHNINFVEKEDIFDEICAKALSFFEYDEDGKKGKFINSQQQTIINNLTISSKLMLHAINEQNKLSDFRITAVEKSIRFEIDNGKFKTLVEGKIDRVDVFADAENATRFVRIIDYKTGNETFQEKDLHTGRKIQLFIYLGALEKLEKLCPIGAYYFKIKDDFSSPFSDKDALRTYCLNGATILDEQIIMAQDRSLNVDKPSSDIIPVTCSFKKDEFKTDNRRKGVYEKEQMRGFIDYALEVFKQGTIEIYEGNIEKSPYGKACDYCEFKGVICKGGVCRK